MSDAPSEQPLSQRQRVVGSFVEPDESGSMLLLAIGKVVVAAAGLEKAMLLEIVRLLCEQSVRGGDDASSALEIELAQLSKLPGGELLKRLQALDLPADLAARIDGAIQRRNKLVHHLYEDAELAKAIVDDEDVTLVARRFERLALDCAELAIELQLFAIPRIEALFGTTRHGLIEMVKAMDPAAIPDERDRQQLEALQALTRLDGLATALDELN
jgi:hypothetical protein